MLPETPYLAVEEFKRILLTEPLEEIVQAFVFRGIPYVFREQPDRLGHLQGCLARDLGVPEENILVVGSSKIGFSLNPDAFPRSFHDESDIDVLVHDDRLFDRIWELLLRWHYPNRYAELHGADKRWAAQRKKDVYWGWFQPDRIRFSGLSFPKSLRPLRDISTQWFNTFQGLSLHPYYSDRRVSGRLYRTLKHACLYHIEGLRLIRKSLGEEPQGRS